MKFGQELTAYGENLSDMLPLPQNTTVHTDGKKIGGTMGSVEMLVRVLTPVAMTAGKILTIAVHDSDTDADYQPIGWAFTAIAPSAGVDSVITRFCFPSTIKKYVRCTVSTDDAAATGALALELVYLPR